MRSATVPAVPTMKREGSEAPSLSSVLSADHQTLRDNRAGVLSRRFSRREVDMSSLSFDTSSKPRKQESIEAELKEAISALKRPNRELAVRDLVESAEKRAAAISRSRKVKKPVRNPSFQGVQISATPKTNRQKDIPVSLSFHQQIAMDQTESVSVPTPKLLRVPQSAARTETWAENTLFSSIEATPSRRGISVSSTIIKGSLSVGTANHGEHPSSPLQSCQFVAQSTQTIPQSIVKSPSFTYGIEETPVRKKAGHNLEHSHLSGPWGSGEKENLAIEDLGVEHDQSKPEDDIYESLGWDDADAIDDLA